MLVKGVDHGPGRFGLLLLVLIAGLALGILIGPTLLRGRTWTTDTAAAPAPQPAPTSPSTADLSLLQVDIAPADWKVLAAARERAMAQGMIVQSEAETVPASVAIGPEHASGTVRLKGDWTDHVDSEQWSLRFELDGPVRGMRRFSVQHPKTRGYVMEWLVMETARREGVLAPRHDFVRVSINGANKGVYYLEEHFGKELLEAQGRRDGPIVRFDESAMWATWLQHGFHRTGQVPAEVWPATSVFDAWVDGYNESHYEQTAALSRRLSRALEQARDLRRLLVADMQREPMPRLQALTRLEGHTVDDLFVTDKLGKLLAIYTLYRAFHGLAWHQYRFYYDTVLDRLEPIVFDAGANFLEHDGELAIFAPEARWFRSSDAVMAAAFEQLGRMTEPEWSAALVRDLRPQVERFGAAMIDAGIVHQGIDLGLVLTEVLPVQLQQLREIARPVAAAGFSAQLVGVRLEDGRDLRAVEVEAWASTKVPTQVTGFRFGNGRDVRAELAVVGLAGAADSADAVHSWRNGAVLLPSDGTHVLFRFAADRRLAGLRDIKALKRAIRAPSDAGRDSRIDVAALFRPLAEQVDRTEPLVLRRTPDPDLARHGRPAPPTLLAALEQHPFLHYDFDLDQLQLAPGRHELDGDLLLPDDRALYVPAGTELLMPAGAVIVAAALIATGTTAAPVRLLPRGEADGWGGLLVLGGVGPSRLEHVEIAGVTGIERSGWQVSGGVTFYRAPVEFFDCSFSGARCEDSVNLVQSRFRCERCVWAGGTHDLLDGDFVDGELVGCSFRDSGEDAIDFSGSQVVVRDCTFERIGDKGFSVGEGSTVNAAHCHVLSASIAVASKDRSLTTVDDLTVDAIDSFVLAAYQKKPEFGAARIVATGLHWNGPGPARHLAQTASSIDVDGIAVPTQDVDVDALYRQKVLGK